MTSTNTVRISKAQNTLSLPKSFKHLARQNPLISSKRMVHHSLVLKVPGQDFSLKN